MAISSTRLFTLAISLFMVIPTAESDPEFASDLLTLQSQSQSGVIRLNDRTVSKFITSTKTPRPYHLLIFFDAVQLHDKPDLRLRHLGREFALVASSFAANHNNSNTDLFFCQLEFGESQSSFHLFAVNSLPKIYLIGPAAKSMKDDPEPLSHDGFTRLAESLVQFIESRTKLTVGPIHRPPIVSKTQIGLIVGFLLIWSPFAAKKIFAGDTIFHDSRIWLSGAIFVYFFSVSGTMHTIIRKVPFFAMEREEEGGEPNKFILFYQGRELQFGIEGVTVGFLYTIVGLLLGFVTHVLVYVEDLKAKRLATIFSIIVSFWAVNQVIFLDNWKTGYRIHGFWPSRWN